MLFIFKHLIRVTENIFKSIYPLILIREILNYDFAFAWFYG